MGEVVNYDATVAIKMLKSECASYTNSMHIEQFYPTVANFVKWLKLHPQWRGVIRWNEMLGQIEIVKEPPYYKQLGLIWTGPRPWNGDEDELALRDWFSDPTNNIGAPNKGDTRSIVGLAARGDSYHPVREWLRALPAWDGVARIAGDSLGREPFWAHYMGAQREQVLTKEQWRLYLSETAKMWFRNAVARVMNPGEKVDYILILESRDKGIGKQRWASEGLVPNRAWYRSASPSLSKPADFFRALQGAWIVERPDVENEIGDNFSSLKGMATESVGSWTPKFVEYQTDHPLSSVLYFSTNWIGGLEPEPDRRFWHIHIEKWIDVDAIARDREQIWAEALHYYDSGLPGYPDHNLEVKVFVPIQNDRAEKDLWTSIVRSNLDMIEVRGISKGLTPPLRTTDILVHWCGIRVKDLGSNHRTRHGGFEQRINKIMTDLGWIQKRIRINKQLRYGWIKNG